MKNYVKSAFIGTVLLLTVSFLLGCGGGSGGGSGSDSENSGSGAFMMSVAWPGETMDKNSYRYIPSGTQSFEISITGEWLDEAMTTSISYPETLLTISNIPAGNKVALIRAFGASSTLTAQRKEAFEVISNQTATSEHIPLGIAITGLAENPVFEPSTINVNYGETLYIQNWLSSNVSMNSFGEEVSLLGEYQDLSGAEVIDETFQTILADMTPKITGQTSQAAVNVILHLVSIEITPSTPSVPKGAEEQITATGVYDNGSRTDITDLVTWESFNTNYATVSDNSGSKGLVTAVAIGSANIKATLGEISAVNQINVITEALSSITVSPAIAQVAKGSTQQFQATGTYTDGSVKNITSSVNWVSSGTGTAAISTAGLATTALYGTSNITAVSGSVTSNAALLKSTYSTSYAGVSIPLGREAYKLDVADFNGDGWSDIVTANYGVDYSVGVMTVTLSDGSGGFKANKEYNLSYNPNGVAAGDVNKDGKPDIVVTNYNATSFYVMLNNGDGTFAYKAGYGTAVGPLDVSLDDFNGDGNLDAAIPCYYQGPSIFLGNGDGTFTSKISYSTGSSVSDIETKDLNKDGKIDLVVANGSNNTITVMLGNGDGTFPTQYSYNGAGYTTSLSLGDFNGDGYDDIVLGNYTSSSGSNNVLVFLNKCNGQFYDGVPYTPGNGTSNYATAADLNGDGKVDLICSYSNILSFLPGIGDGTFGTKTDTAAVASYPQMAQAADFNKDGITDIVFANYGSMRYTILFGYGNGTFH